jgi:hypothetical protein
VWNAIVAHSKLLVYLVIQEHRACSETTLVPKVQVLGGLCFFKLVLFLNLVHVFMTIESRFTRYIYLLDSFNLMCSVVFMHCITQVVQILCCTAYFASDSISIMMKMQVQWGLMVGLLAALDMSLMFGYLKSINLKSNRDRSSKGKARHHVGFFCD